MQLEKRLLSVDEYTAFYEELNRTMEGTNALKDCDDTLQHTLHLLKGRVQSHWPMLEKIVDLGGHCDCEVLLNVDPETYQERLQDSIQGPNIMGHTEWEEFLNDLEERSCSIA